MKEIFQKYIITICVSASLFVGGFIWDYSVRFFTLPNRVKQMEENFISKAKKDSIYWTNYVLRMEKVIIKQDSVLKQHGMWLEDDYKIITNLKERLSIP